MSNIFINRNRSQGAYTTPIIKQKFMTTDETWYSRAERTKKGVDKDAPFYKKSLKYGANPDLHENHVGMQWSIVDACDHVKLSADQMEEKYRKTETSFPLWKAYNTYESSNQTYDQRLDQYPGPGYVHRTKSDHFTHPSQQSNGFVNYANSGGISRKEDLRNQINSIAEKIAEAKRVKGTLCLNNGKPNGTSWKTPQLDLALQSKSGFKGGETAQRFYMKFPIYRPRGHGAPDVQDDINDEWKKQTTPHMGKTNYLLDSRFRGGSVSNRFGASGDDLARILQDEEGSLRYEKTHVRNNSFQQKVDSTKGLKLAGRNTLQFPKRERFNEDTESVIAEQRMAKTGMQKLTGKNLNVGPDQRSNAASEISYKSKAMSKLSRKSMSKSDLAKFFTEKKAKNEEDAKSRISQLSSGSKFKAKFLKKLDDKATIEQAEVNQVNQDISKEDLMNEDFVGELQNQPEQEDAATVATSAVDQLSVAQTELLAQEYKKLIEQYDQEIANRKQLEQEVDKLRAESEQQGV